MVKSWAIAQIPAFAAMLVFPVGAGISGLWKGISWVIANRGKLQQLLDTVGQALELAVNGAEGVGTAVVKGLEQATSLLLSLAFQWLGVTGVVQQVAGFATMVLNVPLQQGQGVCDLAVEQANRRRWWHRPAGAGWLVSNSAGERDRHARCPRRPGDRHANPTRQAEVG